MREIRGKYAETCRRAMYEYDELIPDSIQISALKEVDAWVFFLISFVFLIIAQL
jgi:hypothetical protein